MKILRIEKLPSKTIMSKPLAPKPLTLAGLNKGDIAQITGISDSSSTRSSALRLLELGFVQGSSVRVDIKKGGSSGITVFTVSGCKIAVSNICADLLTCKRTGTFDESINFTELAKEVILIGKNFLKKTFERTVTRNQS